MIWILDWIKEICPQSNQKKIKFSLEKITWHRACEVFYLQCPAFIQNYQVCQEPGQTKWKQRKKKAVVKRNRPVADACVRVTSHGTQSKYKFFSEWWKYSETDCNDHCATVWIYLGPLYFT